MSANVVLDAVTAGARPMVDALDPGQAADPLTVLDVLLSDGRLEPLLGLASERTYRFKRRRYGANELVTIDLRNLILDWVRGL